MNVGVSPRRPSVYDWTPRSNRGPAPPLSELIPYLAVVSVIGACFFATVVLAVGQLRKALDKALVELVQRQQAQIRRLVDYMGDMKRHQDETDAQVQQLLRNHRQVLEELAAMRRRLGDDEAGRKGDQDRVLH